MISAYLALFSINNRKFTLLLTSFTIIVFCYRYNVIGKYETLLDDAWLVLKKAHLQISFPRSDRPSNTNSLVEDYTSQLTQEELLHLYHIYELDFRLFDYHYPGFE